MNPVAFSIGGFGIRWYGILIATGMILGILISNYNCKWRDVDYDNLLNIVLLAIPIGIIGARLYYVVFEFDNYKDNIMDAFNIRNGGLAIHGGLIFAIVTALIYTTRKKLSFIRFADVAAPSIILAQALGRWGNFFNQEAHGDAVSYEFIKHFPMFIQNGMNINGVYYNPTFLYESVWNILIFIILMIMLRKSKTNGIVFFSYIGLYSIGRFVIEGMRTDSLMLGNIRMAQLVSLAGVVIWIIFLLFSYHRKSKRRI
ncbi:Prolipoprotein diacylglyceryl transferase [Clostridium sp. DL-VIII]|uniref:prolipoprotein diacylglyceryl transferase n=1 Tax=Clostridium sp. DL-VIII TaxID=641107 RepID=UPI00023B073E|nr:prolipoprotein diacylglyceryl transferase [Clostridium sp. DL-VIII]EHJ01016.1 Prolipoprotein diacylglyceryl transferase [Clostridium sp. DL-VIII]